MARESSPHPHASAFGVNSAGAKATLQLLADYGGDLARLARLEDHNSALGVLFLADRTAAAAWQTESTVCDKLQWVPVFGGAAERWGFPSSQPLLFVLRLLEP